MFFLLHLIINCPVEYIFNPDNKVLSQFSLDLEILHILMTNYLN